MLTCGLMNANFVTVPVSVVRRSLSDSAFEWCAKTETEIRSNPAINAEKTKILAFIVNLQIECDRVVAFETNAPRLVNQTASGLRKPNGCNPMLQCLCNGS